MSGGLETDLAKMVAAHVRKKGCQEYQERESHGGNGTKCEIL